MGAHSVAVGSSRLPTRPGDQAGSGAFPAQAALIFTIAARLPHAHWCVAQSLLRPGRSRVAGLNRMVRVRVFTDDREVDPRPHRLLPWIR